MAQPGGYGPTLPDRRLLRLLLRLPPGLRLWCWLDSASAASSSGCGASPRRARRTPIVVLVWGAQRPLRSRVPSRHASTSMRRPRLIPARRPRTSVRAIRPAQRTALTAACAYSTAGTESVARCVSCPYEGCSSATLSIGAREVKGGRLATGWRATFGDNLSTRERSPTVGLSPLQQHGKVDGCVAPR